MKHKYKLTILLLLLSIPLFAENITVKTEVDRQTLAIADPLKYKVTLTAPYDILISTYQEQADFGSWSIADVRLPKTKEPNTSAIEFTLLTYSTGTAAIPQITIACKDKEGRPFTVQTSSLSVLIESLVAKYGDTGDIRDIKNPLNIPHPPIFYITWIMIVLGLGIGLYLWYRNYQNRIRAKMPESKEPAEPPYNKALRELEALKNSVLIKEGKIKEYYIALFDIARDYFSAIYSIETRDRTSSEIYTDLRQKETDKKLLTFIKEFFESCDMVKFAKYRPEEDICLKDWDMAKTIIETPVHPR